MSLRHPLTAPLSIALLTGLLFCGLHFTVFFEKLEWKLFDQWSRLAASHRSFDDSIAFVLFDEASLESLGKERSWNWPWPRSSYAKILFALHNAGAEKVYFDLLFKEPSDASEDDQLIAMSQVSGNAYFASTPLSPSFLTPHFTATLREEKDRIVRRDSEYNHLIAWSAPFSIAAKDRGFPASTIFRLGEDLLKNSKADPYSPLSLKDALAQIPPDPALARLKGKIVFVATTAAGTHDLIPSPMGGKEPGVFAHAMFASNQLTGDHIREISIQAKLASILFLPLILAFGLFLRPNLGLQAGGIIAGIPLLLGLSYLGFIYQWWIPTLTPVASFLFCGISLISLNYWREGKQKRQIQRLFGDFLSHEVVKELVADPDNLKMGGVKRNLTVAFSDLAGFTDFSEKLSPEELVEVMNFYLNEMSEFVLNEKGFIDKYIGDAIMAVFGAPLPLENHAEVACRVALYSKAHLEKLNPDIQKRWGFTLYARFGINTGDMVIGQMGSLRKRNYTVIGDAVNLASRLEGANKPYGTTIMIAESTRLMIGSKFLTRPTDLLRVKGKQLPVPVHDLLNFTHEATAAQQKGAEATQRGFDAYRRQQWGEAEAAYREALAHLPGDSLSEIYLKRIDAFRKNPPASDWDGVYILKEK